MNKFRSNIFLIQTTSKYIWLSAVCKILTFKVIFLCLKLSQSFKIIILLKNIILGAHFSLLTFFEALYYLKMCPIFVSLEVVRSSLYQKIFVLNLLIYIYLQCVSRSLWSATTLDTLTPGSVLKVYCSSGFDLNLPKRKIRCKRGEWKPEMPICR